MLKIFIFSLFFSLGIQVSFSQAQPDSRLLARFSQTKLDDLELNSNETLKFWNFYLTDSYFVIDVGSKALDFPDLYSIPAIDQSTGVAFDVSSEDPSIHTSFNPFKFIIPQRLNRRSAYKINNTQIVVFISKNELIENFKQSL